MKKEYVIIHVELTYSSSEYVLLIMKDRPAWQKGFFNLVGGKVEEGETPRSAALRELKEETGYEPHYYIQHDSINPIGILETDDDIIHCFRIPIDENIHPEPKPRNNETEIVRWYPWTMVRNDSRLIPTLRVMVPLMLAKISDWKIYCKDSIINNDGNIVQLTMPSHSHRQFKENETITKILDGVCNKTGGLI